MVPDFTGVILAGGKNSRLPGKKKSFHAVGGKMIMDSIHDLFTTLFERIIIVANEPEAFTRWNALVVSDIYASRCPLAGIHAGLFYASTPYVFVLACDTPFIKKNLAAYILSAMGPGIDVVVPQTKDGLEPLCAAYSKDCLPLIERNLDNNILMVKKFFRKKKTIILPCETLSAVDPGMNSFININTPEDLETARQMADKLNDQGTSRNDTKL